MVMGLRFPVRLGVPPKVPRLGLGVCQARARAGGVKPPRPRGHPSFPNYTGLGFFL